MNRKEIEDQIKAEVDNMDEEQKEAFFRAMFEKFKFNKLNSSADGRAKRRRPMKAVRKERRAKNRAAAKARAKNRK